MLPRTEPRLDLGRVTGALWADFGPARARLALRRLTTPLDLRGPFPTPTGRPSFFVRNVTAGVFGGDHYDVQLRTTAGAHVTVDSPSATQIFASTGASACVALRLEAEPASSLAYTPQPTILHAGAALEQSIDLICHPGATLLFAETLLLGRLAMGERLAFASLDSHLQLRGSSGAADFEERYSLHPQSDPATIESAIDGAGAIVTIVLAGCAGATDERERLAARLATLPGCYAGVDDLPHGAGLLVRGLAVDARAAQTLTDLAYSLFVGSESDATGATRRTHALPR